MFEGKAMESRVGHVALVVPRYCCCCCRSKCGWVGTTRPPLISFILSFYFSRPFANSWMQQAEVVVIVPCCAIRPSAVQCSAVQRGATWRNVTLLFVCWNNERWKDGNKGRMEMGAVRG